MIVHVVLFEPRPDLTDAQRQRVFDDLRRSAGTIPSVRRFRVGRRVQHGLPGYEQVMRDPFSFVVVVEFDDLTGLKTYLQHPAHEAIGQHFGDSVVRALAYDYSVFDAEDPDAAAHLLARG